jgi:hypothetical protein
MEETEEDYLSKIVNPVFDFLGPVYDSVNPNNTAISQGGQPASNYYMESPAPEFGSPPPLQPNAVNSEFPLDRVYAFKSRTVATPEERMATFLERKAASDQATKQDKPIEQNLPPIEGFEKRTNVLAPFGTSVNKSFSPMMSPEQEVQSQVQPISKQEQEAPKDNYFRESVGGILVALGAGFQGADASKALERYNSAIQNDKDEIRRQTIEQERKRKLDPSSQGNIAFKAMFEKYVPGVREMMGKNYDNMTEDMLRSSYPMIANGIKAATEKELSNPASESSIDAVKSYNQMISVFGGKIPPLAEGKISAKEVDKHMGKIDDFLRYNQNEARMQLDKDKFAQDKLFNQQTQDLQNKKFGLQQKEFEQGKAEANRRANLQEREFAYRKQRDAEARKQAALLQQKNSAMSDKEARRIAEKYPSGLVISDTDHRKLLEAKDGYVNMSIALRDFKDVVKKYGSPALSTSQGYAEVNGAWAKFLAALKEAERLGALDNGVSKLAAETIPNPTDLNAMRRLAGKGKLEKDTLTLLDSNEKSYKEQFARKASNFGFNPLISSDENVKLMDEFINPATSTDRQKQIYMQNYQKLGYTPDEFNKYAGNYISYRKPFLGGQ